MLFDPPTPRCERAPKKLPVSIAVPPSELSWLLYVRVAPVSAANQFERIHNTLYDCKAPVEVFALLSVVETLYVTDVPHGNAGMSPCQIDPPRLLIAASVYDVEPFVAYEIFALATPEVPPGAKLQSSISAWMVRACVSSVV